MNLTLAEPNPTIPPPRVLLPDDRWRASAAQAADDDWPADALAACAVEGGYLPGADSAGSWRAALA